MVIEGRHWLEWTPYDDGATVIFDSGGLPFVLQDLSGFSSNLLKSISRSSPGQLGETLIGLSAGGRTLSIGVAVVADEQDRVQYWELRDQLIEALATPLPPPGQLPEMGTLRLYRPGKPTLKLEAIPVDSPRETGRPDPVSVQVDIAFFVPEPYWKLEDDTTSALSQTATEFPLTMPMEIQSFNISVEITNEGHVDVPIVARIYGEVVNPRLINDALSQQIDLEYTIGENDYAEFNTAFGRKEATLHKPDGTIVNLLPYLDLSDTTFWSLRRGSQQIRFEADNNISGSAEILWSPRFAGV